MESLNNQLKEYNNKASMYYKKSIKYDKLAEQTFLLLIRKICMEYNTHCRINPRNLIYKDNEQYITHEYFNHTSKHTPTYFNIDLDGNYQFTLTGNLTDKQIKTIQELTNTSLIKLEDYNRFYYDYRFQYDFKEDNQTTYQ